MSIVKDTSLAEYGRMKIAWVRDFMPALGAIRERMERWGHHTELKTNNEE